MERPFVMHLYGHSHVRRFMEFLDDKPGYTVERLPQLSEANSLRKKKDPSAETPLPNMGFATGRFRFMADQGYSLPQIKDKLESTSHRGSIYAERRADCSESASAGHVGA